MSPALALRTAFRAGTMFVRRLTCNSRLVPVTFRHTCVDYGSFSHRLSTPVLSRCGRSLLPSRVLSNYTVAAAGADVAEEPAKGSPEAPPQTPPQLETVPGTEVPVEEVILPEAKVPLSSDKQQSALTTDEEQLISEVVDEAIVEAPKAPVPPVGTASAAGTLEEGSGASAGSSHSPEHEDFIKQWGKFMEVLKEKGYYQELGDDGTPMSSLGAAKKALLTVGRSRPDIFFALDSAKVALFTVESEKTQLAGALRDRKCINALERLKASLLDKEHLKIGRGGAAEFLDICRVLFAIHSESARKLTAAPLVKPVLHSQAADLLRDIEELASKKPSPDAVAKADAAAAQKQQQVTESAALRVEMKQARRDSEGNFYARARNNEPGGRGRGNAPSAPYDDNRRPLSNSNFKQGDWYCPQCSTHNFARNVSCFSCAAPRPAEIDQSYHQPMGPPARNYRPGDWVCPECNAHNFANKDACYRCFITRPEDAVMPAGSKPPTTQMPKPGDWKCLECGANNFAWRHGCFKCDAPRSNEAPVVPESGYRAGGSFERGPPRILRGGGYQQGGREVRAGDWSCPECNFHNFSSKTVCHRCGLQKPPGSEMSPTTGNSDYRAGGRGSYGGRDPYGGRDSYRGRSTNWSGSSEQPKADLDW